MSEILKNPYLMNISLNVLDHLGLELYINTPAVDAEVITNAWNADATGSLQQPWTSLQNRAKEFTGRRKARMFAYDEYLAMLHEGVEVL